MHYIVLLDKETNIVDILTFDNYDSFFQIQNEFIRDGLPKPITTHQEAVYFRVFNKK